MTDKITFRQSRLVVLAFSVLTLALGAVSLVRAESPAVMPEGTSPAACLSITNTLRFGSTDATTGGEVTKLQNYIGVVPATGYFGPLTQAAVQQWQVLNQIVTSGTPDTTGFGVVGPRSRAALAAGCLGEELSNSSSLAPQADFYFDATDVPVVRHSLAECELGMFGDACGSVTLRGTAQNVDTFLLVHLNLTGGYESLSYDPNTDTYTGSITYQDLFEQGGEYGECNCVTEITTLAASRGSVEHWEQRVLIGIDDVTDHFALFDDSGRLLDYIAFAPSALVSVNTDEIGVVSGRRVNGTAEVPEVVVRVVEEGGTSDESIYVSEPIDVKDGRWWHRITVPLTASVYSLFLETPDGTPLFQGTYEPEGN